MELEPAMLAAARQAAAGEHERTREWLESKGLPKAARVAQRETYDVLRRYGIIEGASRPSRSRAEVGLSACGAHVPSHRLTEAEVEDFAEAALAVLATQGRCVDETLSGMRAEAGGFLEAEDFERVREKVGSLLAADKLSGARNNFVG
ncbi:MAG TPA: hypothetical protein VF508_03080 [Pyrinomonadaceae bacterium]|jgi:hypothetical protein